MHPLRSRSPGAGATRATRASGNAATPTVAGFTLCRALHASGGGALWRARQTATGYDVVLRPLPAGVDAADFDTLPDHPHLAVPSVVVGPDGCSYAVTRHAPHGGLDALLERRGALAPGEVTNVLLAVGRALASMHAQGRAHGCVRAAAVLLDAGVRPLLDGSSCRPAGGAARLQTEDVRALGALAIELLGSEVPPELRVCLSAATDPDPRLRPLVTELVRLGVGAVPPEALRLTAAADRAAPPVRRVRSVRRRHGAGRSPHRWRPAVLPLLAAAALLTLAVVAGAAWARVSEGSEAVPQGLDRPVGPTVPPASTSGSPTAPPDWGRVLDDLDTARTAAFANADELALASVDAPGSPAMTSDASAVRALAQRRLQARGFRIAVLSVRPVSVDARTVVLDVTDHRTAYEVVGAGGAVVSTQPARAPARWRVQLVRVRGTWLVEEVSRA